MTCKKVSLQKYIEFGMALKSSVTRYKQNAKYYLLPDQQVVENLILIFGFHKRRKM